MLGKQSQMNIKDSADHSFGFEKLFPTLFQLCFSSVFSYLPIMALVLWMKKPEEKFGKCFEKIVSFLIKKQRKSFAYGENTKSTYLNS